MRLLVSPHLGRNGPPCRSAALTGIPIAEQMASGIWFPHLPHDEDFPHDWAATVSAHRPDRKRVTKISLGQQTGSGDLEREACWQGTWSGANRGTVMVSVSPHAVKAPGTPSNVTTASFGTLILRSPLSRPARPGVMA